MPRVKQFDEKEVLQNAMALFWKKGFHATSIQDLVDHLGINRASLYGTFGGKKELFEQAFQLYRSQNITAMIQFLEKQPSVKQGLLRLFEMSVEDSVSDSEKKGCFVVNTTTELVPGDSAIQEVLKINKDTFEKVYYELLLKGEANGEIPPGKDLRAIARLLFLLNNGLKVVSKIQPEREQLMRSIRTVLSLLD